MAITGDNGALTTPELKLNVDQYSKEVGAVQGDVVSGKQEWAESDDNWKNPFYKDKGSRNEGNYDSDTVVGTYVLKGKAGITPDFYRRFSDSFNIYKTTILGDLKKLQTNPTIGQAFRGTEIEKSIKNLILAVEAEANDYLFKLEQREKTVIESVKRAFERQQSQMGTSMQSDTEKLKQGNSTADDISAFKKESASWYTASRTGSN